MVKISIQSRIVDDVLELPGDQLPHFEQIAPSLVVESFGDDGSVTIEVEDKEAEDLMQDLEASEWKNTILP